MAAGNLTESGAKRLANIAANDINNDVSADSRRARLRPKPAAMGQILGTGNILQPLKATNGMVWPYQPTITYQQGVSYTDVSMTHTNQEFYAYAKTDAVKLVCESEFTVQNQDDGKYSLACIHFLRTITKMYFGQSSNLGTPPPVLLFDAYGQYMFNRLPVIVTNFTVTMPKDINYVPIDVSSLGKSFTTPYVWLPAVFSITVNMTVQNTPSRLRQFNLDDFRNGTLLSGGGWI
jgi:hypothetical protein